MIIAITILAASLLFLILVYPTFQRLYKIFNIGKEQLKREDTAGPNLPEISKTEISILGKSTFRLSQPLPTTTITMVKEPIIEEDEPTFATESDPVPMDIDYPLDREGIDNEIDEDQESIELEEMFGKDICYASGVLIEDLQKLKHVTESAGASRSEQEEVGKMLYENKETDIVEQLLSGKTASFISNLIDIHVTLQKEEQGILKVINGAEELESFDVNKFLNTK